MCANAWYFVTFTALFGFKFMRRYIPVTLIFVLYPIGHDLAAFFIPAFYNW